jgi:hypothetical protein
MMAAAGMSAAVSTARTPGMASARRASMPTSRAVRVARAKHHRFERALGADVGHEAAAAGEERLGAEPRERRPDHATRGRAEGSGRVTGGS